MKKILLIVFMLVSISLPSVHAGSYGWGFKRNSDHEQPDIGIYAQEIEGTSSYYVGPKDEKIVFLTFDAGYDNGGLMKILDVLDEKNVKSTFFVTGDFIERESELLMEIIWRGHLVGNHTWSHKDITKLSEEELEDELRKVEAAYEGLAFSPLPKLFRPPSGQFNKQSLLRVQKLGYKTFFWSLAYKDWLTDKQQGEDYAYRSVMDNLHNGAIILLHTVSEDNCRALGKIIDGIRNEGYTIANLDYFLKSNSSERAACGRLFRIRIVRLDKWEYNE